MRWRRSVQVTALDKKRRAKILFRAQPKDPEVRRLVEEELKALRVGGSACAAPSVSRIEASPSQNLTLGILVRLVRTMDYEAEITFKPRRGVAAAKR
jgi:hypothetical protein